MTKTKSPAKKHSINRSPERVRASIVHPTLVDAFDVDWYYPWTLPEDAKKEKCVQRAIREGWVEWIESPEDLDAVRNGYVFDLSRDKQGNPIYWHAGRWVRYQGEGKNKRLVPIRGDEETFVGYCGAGDHMCRFAELFLNFTKEPLKGKPYRFMKWQRKLCMTLFGWVSITKTKEGKTVKYRRFNEAMIELPKKSGKSDVGSVISVYLVRADFATKAYVYGVAAGKKQAAILYDEAADYVEKSDYLADEIQVVRSKQRYTHIESGSYYQVLSGDAGSNDGPDASAVLFDELHRQKNRKMLAVLQRSGRARRSRFMMFIITTYGETLKGVWGEEHKRSKAQLAGTKSNYRRLVMIASAEPIAVTSTRPVQPGSTSIDVWRLEQPIDAGELLKFESSGGGVIEAKLTAPAKRFQPFIECEPLVDPLPAFSEAIANKDWQSDHAIIRANPSVNIVYPIEEIREDRERSKGSPEAEAEFKQLSLNIVSGGGHRWLSGAVWQHNARHRVLMSSLISQRCYGALDFSFRTDLTAFWLAFPTWPHNIKFAKVKNPLIRLIGMIWVPEEGLEEREKKEEIPYRAYAEIPYVGDMGCVRICPGPVINYQMMAEDTLALCSRFKLQATAYDPAYSQFVIDPYLIPGGVKCIPHRQGALSMGPPTKRFEELLKRGLIAHGSHPLLDEAVNGAVLHPPDKAGNRFPAKEKSTSRIDALLAAIMAVGWACDPPVELKNTGAWTGKGTGAFG